VCSFIASNVAKHARFILSVLRAIQISEIYDTAAILFQKSVDRARALYKQNERLGGKNYQAQLFKIHSKNGTGIPQEAC